ncbi:MAG: uroporphyrinogen-III synthase [Albidovulum sp.]|nr:uroporphyrinogen-III synthase [Albidovulum sp.]MDE0532215.1 uroporphyrinogen-III synthase [Albidovulum sp.]
MAVGREINVVLSPLLETVRLESDIDLSSFETIVFSSANGVKALAENRPATGAVAYCVGDQTAAAAAAVGYRTISANGSARDLAELVAKLWSGEKMVYACGRSTAFDLAGFLAARCVPIEVAVLYDQKPLKINTEAKIAASEESCLFPVYSARTGRILAREVRSISDNSHVVACMSESIAEEVSPLRWKSVVAGRPDAESLMETIIRWHLI